MDDSRLWEICDLMAESGDLSLFMAAVRRVLVENQRLRKEVAVDDDLLKQRALFKADVLAAIGAGECPLHGDCMPHAIEQVKKLVAENVQLRHQIEAIHGPVPDFGDPPMFRGKPVVFVNDLGGEG